MFINVGLIIVIVIAVFVIGGGLIYWFAYRSSYRHLFWVWSKDLSNHYVVKAKIIVDKENKSNRLFAFSRNSSKLIMRDPVHWSNGKPIRWVIPDESGEYQYLSPCNKVLMTKDVVDAQTGETKLKPVDDVRYMQTRLHPTDKQLALEQMRNNQNKFTIKDIVGLTTFLSLMGLTAIIIIGAIYGLSVVTKNAQAVGDNSKILRDMSAAHDAASERIVNSMREVTNNLAYIYGQIASDGNVTIVRSVTGVQP